MSFQTLTNLQSVPFPSSGFNEDHLVTSEAKGLKWPLYQDERMKVGKKENKWERVASNRREELLRKWRDRVER